MNILFYDINLINLKNYVGDLIVNLSEKHSVILMYDEYNSSADLFFQDVNCKLIKCTKLSYNGMTELFRSLAPDLVVVNAQRISDSALLAIAKKSDVETLMIQHGMYIPFMKRERFFFFKKIAKTFKYLLYSNIVSKAINESSAKVFYAFYRVFVRGDPYRDTIYFYDEINADNVFVYGDYWKGYHATNFGYQYGCQQTIGYHELSKVDLIKGKPCENGSVCYIAQTLVEDGRLSRDMMVLFLSKLASLDVENIYIKLHPRSDLSLYKSDRFVLLPDVIPHVDTYIGHYSSLLALTSNLNAQQYLFEFENHPVPDYFNAVAYVESDMETFFSSVIKKEETPVTDNFDYYFKDGYESSTVSDLICNLLPHNLR